MSRKFIKPGEFVGLRLIAAERTLLVQEMPVLGEILIKRIKDAPPDRIKVLFMLDEVKALAGHLSSGETTQCESKTRQKALNAINRKVQHLLKTHTDDKAEARAAAMASFTAAGIDLSMLDPVSMLTAELAAMGVSMDVASKSIKPRTIGPEDKIMKD